MSTPARDIRVRTSNPLFECDGALVVFIADESSWACQECYWIGWPRQDVDPSSGVIVRQYPHPRRVPREEV